MVEVPPGSSGVGGRRDPPPFRLEIVNDSYRCAKRFSLVRGRTARNFLQLRELGTGKVHNLSGMSTRELRAFARRAGIKTDLRAGKVAIARAIAAIVMTA